MTKGRTMDAIERAKAADPGNAFVASCERHLSAHGFLSEKQLAAINRVTPTRRPLLDLAGPPTSWSAGDTDDHGLGQSWDWAGGE